jgi:1-deoxy-D-xylulose-5-phosphate synthase
MEAINQAGHLKSRLLIVVLNDTEMSIRARGRRADRLPERIRGAHGYHRFKDEVEEKLLAIPSVGERLHHAAKTMKDMIAAAVLPGALVHELGFKYIGYVDGHNPRALVAAFEEAKQIKDGPVIVHALTTKGKGFPETEPDYYRWHATGPFDLKTGKPHKSSSKIPTYTTVFGNTLAELMEKDPKVVALTAAMPDGTGVCTALEKFPDRAFDVGIAEQHCVTFAAGMSCEGLKPVCAIYSTFLQRGFDQLIHDVCIQDLNVKFCLDRGGIAGRRRPDASRSARHRVPARRAKHRRDGAERRRRDARHDVHDAGAHWSQRRCVTRGGNGVGVPIDREPELLEIGKGEILRDGGEVAIVAYGAMVHPSLAAAERLAKERIETTVVNARFVKPLDTPLLLALARTKRLIVTVEEAYLAGGFGSAVMELLEENGLQDRFAWSAWAFRIDSSRTATRSCCWRSMGLTRTASTHACERVSKYSMIAAPGQEFSHKKARKAQKRACVFCGTGVLPVHEIESFPASCLPKNEFFPRGLVIATAFKGYNDEGIRRASFR